MIAVVAEKPSVARDLAQVLGAKTRGAGYLHGNGYVVTWAIGHLVGLAEPQEIRAEWKSWRWDQLPMFPEEWPLVVHEKTRDQFAVVRQILTSPKVTEVVCATDAGREGQLIFRFIYEAAGCRKKTRRLWISSLTDSAIRKGFASLREGVEFKPLADAALGRSRADWLVGMNLSRAYGISLDEPLSVGRVQTPTLAMLVERELAIRDFVPEDYLEVWASFERETGARYDGVFFREGVSGAAARRLPIEGSEAEALLSRVRSGNAAVRDAESEVKRLPPPLLHDLTELQRQANRLYGFPARKTLDVAQALYEQHKLLSYPRTSSRHLSSDVAQTLRETVQAICAPYRELLAPGTGERPLSGRFVDDAKVTDHHAIIPTPKTASLERLSSDERKIYELVCRRFLAAWQSDFVWEATRVVTEVRSAAAADLFLSNGTAVSDAGWKKLDVQKDQKPPKSAPDASDEDALELPPGLTRAEGVAVADVKAREKRTSPPRRLTDATLLTAMESAGKTLEEKELSEAMRQLGLGTPATRAAIIETLLTRGYAERIGKALGATERGIHLIAVVDPAVKSAEMTGRWEARLQQIERGGAELEAFLEDIERYIREVLGRMRSGGQGSLPATRRTLPQEPRGGARPPSSPAAAEQGALSASSSGTPTEGRASVSLARPPASTPAKRELLGARPPVGVEGLRQLLQSQFGFSAFRPHQEEVCRAAVQGEDALLVMPTGAGKSLCYQLPALARGGTALVVSPLIALMEDQVAKLKAAGIRAERIHSGRERAQSRAALEAYEQGALDLLFVAPERLGVPGFIERLSMRLPSLIAIDEAHCISQWGHDFRPDYRLLGERLPRLRPAPVLALTATATPAVQRDIVEQLGLKKARLFIHGFRRENIAVEVLELNPGERAEAALELLQSSARRPAIVYAPSRKRAEEFADLLGGTCPSAAYHAGLSAKVRDEVQSRFLAGSLEVIVATTAFGMGVDKADVRTVVHLGMPGSVEGYYQEIGRAGRDGKPSRAVLLYSYVDLKTHDFFHRRQYPEASELGRIHRLLEARERPRAEVERAVRMDAESFENALTKLWVHGGVLISPEEGLTRGSPSWQPAYERQRAFRQEQVRAMQRYAESTGCRMLRLVEHFGDDADRGAPCGKCDRCAPNETLRAYERATPTAQEITQLERILELLREQDGQSTGRLSKQVLGDTPEARREFDRLLEALASGGLLRIEDDTFEKDGKAITFRRARLTPEGRCGAEVSGLQLRALPGKSNRKKSAAARSATGLTGGRKDRKPRAPRSALPAAQDGALHDALRAWRLSEAKRRKVPAFRIFTDRVLVALVEACPIDEGGLLAVAGVGPKLVKDHGQALVALCSRAQAS